MVREYSYKIKGLLQASDETINKLCSDFSNVNGVIGLNVIKEEEKVEYALDQWSSDYDAFSKLSEICEDCNLELVFEDEIIENDIVSEEEVSKEESVDVQKEPTEIKNKLLKSDFVEKIIVLILSLGFICAGFLFKQKPNLQPWIFMIGFTIASYEILYDIIVKLAEKGYLYEELLTFIGALILTYQGKIAISAIIMLLYSTLNFVVSFAKHKNALKKEELTIKIENCEDEHEKGYLQGCLQYLQSREGVNSTSTQKINDRKKCFTLFMFVLAVLAIFVPPLFTIKTYWLSLSTKWLYLGSCILILNGIGETLFSLSNTEFTAMVKAFENEVKINSIDSFINLTKKSKVSFDKSGVLVKDCKIEELHGQNQTLQFALSSLQGLENHVAKAIKEYAKDVEPLTVENLVINETGVSCTIEKNNVLVGSRKYLKDKSVEVEEIADGKPHLFVACNGSLIGYFTLSNEPFNDSYGAIAEIKHDLSLKTEILSSDEANVVTEIKKQLKADHAVSGASSKFKAERVKKENSIYVGDETNDRTTLSLLDDAISFGSDGKIAITTKSIRKVPFILKLAQRTVKTLKFNKKFACVFKVFVILLAVILRVFTAIDFIWWLFAIDVLARSFTVINSMINSSDVA